MSRLSTVLVLLTVVLVGCGTSQEEQNISASACSVMGDTLSVTGLALEFVASMERAEEMRTAREKLGEAPYLGGDDGIKEAFEYGLCEQLVLNDPNYDSTLEELKRIAVETRLQREEVKRIAREEREESERIAREEREESERIAREEREESERIAEAEAEAELSRVILEYRTAAAAELSTIVFEKVPDGYTDKENEGVFRPNIEGVHIEKNTGYVHVVFAYEITNELLKQEQDNIVLEVASATLDFNDPDLPDFVLFSRSSVTLGTSNWRYEDIKPMAGLDFDDRLTRAQRQLFISKFENDLINLRNRYDNGRLYIPNSAYTLKFRVVGLTTYSSFPTRIEEPWGFECAFFDLLKSKDLCDRWKSGDERATFAEPIEIIIGDIVSRSFLEEGL
jgi:hypothetical protein